MKLIRRLKLIALVLLSINSMYASDFEGSVTFVKETLYDTTYFTFSVKEQLVRIDEKDAKQQILQSLIIDMLSKNIVAVSPTLKLYTTIQKRNVAVAQSHNDAEFVKTDNYKYINGYKCYQWRMRNRSLNCEVSYWVFNSDMDFLTQVFRLLGSTDDYSKYAMYFDQIPQNGGYMPAMIIERTLLRDEKLRVSLQKIHSKKLDNQVFSIPKEYKYLRS